VRHFSSFLLLLSALILSGCSAAPVLTSTVTSAPTGSSSSISISGRVHGGQNPISGAQVYLYAVNNTGYAGPGIAASSSNAAVSLLNAPGYVTTASDGSFSITSDYTCPATTPDVYVLAVGGNSGSGANSAITLAAGLGPCTATGFSSMYVVVNEVSTIAAAFAGAGFATDPTHVSSSGSTLAVRGVEDALAAIDNLETISTGVANTTTAGGNGAVPQAEINTLANILAACVNSNGAVTGPTNPTPCYTLFYNAESGANPATDTATAALNIAHNPGANIANLFTLQGSSPPFLPDLSTAPNDFTIAISFTGGGMEAPYDVAIDAKGDVWAINMGGQKISELNPLGNPVSATGYSGGGLMNQEYAIAIDSSNNVWVASNATGNTDSTLSEFNSSGSPVTSSSGITTGGIDTPRGMTIDKNGNIWVSNRDTTQFSVSEYGPTGTAASGSPFTGGGISYPWGIAADLSGNIWVADKATASDGTGDAISEFTASTGAANANSPIKGGGLGEPIGVAVDASGNIWVTNQTNLNDTMADEGAALAVFNSSGDPVTGADGYTGGGMTEPNRIAIDGAGDVWVADSASNSICAFTSSGTPISGESGHGYGYGTGLVGQPWGLAIDPSGNVWVPNTESGASGAIVEFVGAAAPVVTPMVANFLSPYGSAAVNRP
jgi:sugar lactone lactonase YvrE